MAGRGNLENIAKRKPFVKADPRINRKGRPEGVRDRSTVVTEVLMKALEMPATSKNRALIQEMGLDIKGDAETLMTAVQVARAIINGDTRSYRELMDSRYGMPKQKSEVTITGESIPIFLDPDGKEIGGK